MTIPDPEQSLDDYIDVYAIPNGRFAEGWEPQDDEDAEWAMGVLARAKREVQRIKDAADKKRALVKEWQDHASTGPLNEIKRRELQLLGYRIRLEEADKNLRRTYPLPSGTIARRAGSTSTVVTDEDKFVQWAIENDTSLLKLTPLVSVITDSPTYRCATSRDELKDAAKRSAVGASARVVSADGEEVPGVEIVVGPDTLKVKPS